MYFYSIRPLKERLATGPLPERESLPYLVLFAAATAVAGLAAFGPANGWDRIQSVTDVALAVLGTLILYRANGGGDGRDFLHRYIVVGWVVSVRFVTFGLPLFIGLLLGAEGMGWVGEETGPFDVSLGFAFEVLFLAYFGLHLDDLRRVTDRAAEAAAAGGPSPG